MHWLDVVLTTINFAAGVVVTSEALNKLERIDVFGLREQRGDARAWRVILYFVTPWRWSPGTGERLAQSAAWFACAIGGGGAVMVPFLGGPPRTVADVLALVGFAAIISHARYAEWRMFKQRSVRYEKPESILE